jgi:hypothetical protein
MPKRGRTNGEKVVEWKRGDKHAREDEGARPQGVSVDGTEAGAGIVGGSGGRIGSMPSRTKLALSTNDNRRMPD